MFAGIVLARCDTILVKPIMVGAELPWFVLSVSMSTALSIITTTLFTNHQPKPYMDEFFHVRQTLAYLDGNWSYWDNKITTPPGTYILFLPFYKLLINSMMYFDREHYMMLIFRSFSGVFFAVNHVILWKLMCLLRNPCDLQCLTALHSIMTNPVIFFFSALYYTDQCSLTFVLSGVYFALVDKRLLSSLFFAYAILIRQTNAVWIIFTFAIFLAKHLVDELPKDNVLPSSLSQWLRKFLCWLYNYPGSVLRSICKCMLKTGAWHFLISLAFLCFVRINNSIVLGDRSAHQAVFHLPQFLYFVLFCAVSTPIYFVQYLSSIVDFKGFKNLLSGMLVTCLVMFLVYFSMTYFTFVHPYLIADNRHYTFYLWRKVLHRSELASYALIPVYTAAILYYFHKLFSQNDGGPIALLPLAIGLSVTLSTGLSLIPAGLLELRYFIIPYVMWRVFSMQRFSYPIWLLVEILLNSVVIFVTVYLFIYKPFVWSSEPGVWQRFMW